MSNNIEEYAQTIFKKCEEAFGENINITNATRQQASLYLQSIGETDVRFLYILEKVFKSVNKPEIIILFTNLGLKTITKFWSSLELDFLINFRDFMITYLRESELSHKSILRCVAQLPCRITKLGWNTGTKFKDITNILSSFISGNYKTMNRGIVILTILIDEMNTSSGPIVQTKQRRIASSFRDSDLLNIFNLSIEVLKKIRNEQNMNNSDPEIIELTSNILSLTHKCLNFDFIGTNQGDSSLDFGSIQIPSKWGKIIEPKINSDSYEMHITNILFSLLVSIDNSCKPLCLEVLISLTCCRRSLFSNDETRTKYFSFICDGSLKVFQMYSGMLNDSSVFNSFCRLLVSFKSNYQISSLVKLNNYEAWIKNVAEFTKKAFNLNKNFNKGIHYLLQLWSRFTISLPYFRGKNPIFVNNFIPMVTIQFLESNLNSLIEAAKQNEINSNIITEIELTTLSQYLPPLFRFQYQNSFKWLTAKLDAGLDSVNNSIGSNITPSMIITEVEFSWLIHIISIVINGNIPLGENREQQKLLDAKLCSYAYRMIPYINSRQESPQINSLNTLALLEISLLKFFTSFQKSYIQTHVNRPISIVKSSAQTFFDTISKSLNQQVGQTELISFTLNKLFKNICFWNKSIEIIKESLSVFKTMTSGYDSFKLLLQQPVIKKVIAEHSEQFSSFLNDNINEKHRVIFYSILGKIVFSDSMIDMFSTFIKPFNDTFAFIANSRDYNNEMMIKRTIGICKDLRGVCRSILKQDRYEMFFQWFHDNHFNDYLRLFETLAVSPYVAVPMLRFLEEFVFNRSSRIDFAYGASDGFLLFRSTQKSLSTYANRLINYQIDDSNNKDLYKVKIKGIQITISILTRILSGEYISFGAFEFYKDDSLKNLITLVMNLTLSIPKYIIYSYIKMCSNYFYFLDVLLRYHTNVFSYLSDDVLTFVLDSLYDGIQSARIDQSNSSCNCIQALFSFIILNSKKTRKTKQFMRIVDFVSKHMESLLNFTHVIFSLILFENAGNQFALFRALCPLLFYDKRLLEYYAKVLVEAQPMENRNALSNHLKKLVEVTSDQKLTSASKDKFSKAIMSLKIHVATASIVQI